MTQSNRGVVAAVDAIARAGGSRISPPSLLPAQTMIELSGEEVRARLCIFSDAVGTEWCLRPDLTTPIAAMVASGQAPPARYQCGGAVFRLPPAGHSAPIEHRHVGFEWFGADTAREDAEAAVLTLEAAAAGGVRQGAVRFSDVALYCAVVDALPFSENWRRRLKRAFGHRVGPEALLSAPPREMGAVGATLSASLARLSPEDALRAVEEILAIAGSKPVAGRTSGDIAARLLDRNADSAPELSVSAALLDYLALDAPADQCMPVLSACLKRIGARLPDAILDRFSARLDALASAKAPLWSGARFSAAFGRRFEYYDGFVFELAVPEAPDNPVASGGRYDGLVARLSQGARNVPAIGATLRADALDGAIQ